MKYALIAALMLVAALAVGALLAFLLKKARHATWSARRQLALSAAFGLGGNHAGFGSYGAQRGDGTATISAQEQQDQAALAIVALAHDIAG